MISPSTGDFTPTVIFPRPQTPCGNVPSTYSREIIAWNDFGTGKNWLSVQWQSVNPDYVVPRLREVFIKTRQKIDEILNAPEAKGDQVIWANMAMDGLTKYNLEQKESLQ